MKSNATKEDLLEFAQYMLKKHGKAKQFITYRLAGQLYSLVVRLAHYPDHLKESTMETDYPPSTSDQDQGELELTKPCRAEQRAAVPTCPFCLMTHLTMQAYNECKKGMR